MNRVLQTWPGLVPSCGPLAAEGTQAVAAPHVMPCKLPCPSHVTACSKQLLAGAPWLQVLLVLEGGEVSGGGVGRGSGGGRGRGRGREDGAAVEDGGVGAQ